MRLLKVDRKNSFIEVVAENLDDLWHLERVIEKGDLVSGKSERKIKSTEGREAEKLIVFAEVKTEKIELHPATKQLRVSGPLTLMKPVEFFDAGAFHSIEIEEGRKIKIAKEKLKNYQIERLQKAAKAGRKEKVLLVVLDDERATLAMVRDYGLEKKAEIKSGKTGKQFKAEKGQKQGFFSEIIEAIKQAGAGKTVVAGPGFTKKEFIDYCKEKSPEIKPLAQNTNSVGETGLNELVKGGVLEKIMQQSRLSEETGLMEKVMEEIGKGTGLVCYGEKDVQQAVEKGAIGELLVSDKKLFGERKKAEELLEKTEQLGGKVHVISSKNDAGKKLDGLGGMAGLLRFKLT